MRKALVYYKNEVAGTLTQFDDGSFEFQYTSEWMENNEKPAISLTLTKNQASYKSKYLFPFFYNMLPEGSNKERVCFLMRIDKNDHFGLLLTTAKTDTIGAVRIKKIEEQ